MFEYIFGVRLTDFFECFHAWLAMIRAVVTLVSTDITKNGTDCISEKFVEFVKVSVDFGLGIYDFGLGIWDFGFEH